MEIKMIELATDYAGCTDRIGHRLHRFSQMEINGNKNDRTGHRLHGFSQMEIKGNKNDRTGHRLHGLQRWK
jgi:uncharacterized protein YigA (DUF484 family)